MSHDVAIVGGGLFGRVIGAHLRHLGHDVVILDRYEEGTGLKAAGCLIKKSWISKVPDQDMCFDLLDTLFGIRTIEFAVQNKHLTTDSVFYADKDQIFDVEVTRENVFDAEHGVVICREDRAYEAKHIIVCRGGWGKYQKPRWGATYWADGQTDPFIKAWRPFTQLVKFNMSEGRVWAGDGTAVQQWSEDYDNQTRARVQKFLDPLKISAQTLGMRPYGEKTKDPCNIIRFPKHIEVTGGAKNGTIGAAWAALQIGKEIS